MPNDVEIGVRTQLTTEVRPWQIEMQPEEDSGDVLGTATATLTDLLTGAAFATGLVGTPDISGTTVTQSVGGLIAGHNYRLVLTVSMGGSKQTATSLILSCPY